MRPISLLSTLCLALHFTPLALAGPLTPPAGPVASTAKALSEIEPRIAINATNTPGNATSLFRITQPGSYYLTGNIAAAGKSGITILASGVQIDLNGFDLQGSAAAGTLSGISIGASSLRNIVIRNGSVRGWLADGIDLFTNSPSACRIEAITASGNGTHGIHTADGCVVINCVALGNTGDGISTGNANMIANCTAFVNSGSGIVAGTGCTISDCAGDSNSFIGILANNSCSIQGCSAAGNGTTGISVGELATICNSSARDNGGTGIATSFGSLVSTCTSGRNVAFGISASAGSTIIACTAYTNTASGISVTTGCAVLNCLARQNTLDGIVCSSNCVIRGNLCTANGLSAGDGAGIHALFGTNRIEGNTCIGADRGIDIDNSASLIISNACTGNTVNWDIAAGNRVGPIVSPTGGAAFVGSGTSASSLTSTDPYANFNY